ncbi:hypothetical protein [Serinicoccus profundi]|uniref:hypothetical protein n=1 Tax=Serinicoccus profundi TaxID=1078471 RepID=UPI000255EB03|nr:hypothetical protein [Serinicoccus profundi]
MEKFVDDDDGFLRWITQHQGLFVLNTHRSPRADNLRLHRADCRLFAGIPPNGKHWTATYVKFCGSRDELERWALGTVGGDVWPCSVCLVN